MGFLNNNQNIVNSEGDLWSITRGETNIEFRCWREEGIVGSYNDGNYIPFMTSTLTEESYPRVLVSGLGIGVVPQWLCENKQSVVDVIEIDQGLVTAINNMNYLHDNVNIINADINEYSTIKTYDLIYFDHLFYPNENGFEALRDSLVSSFTSNKNENGRIVFPVHKQFY